MYINQPVKSLSLMIMGHQSADKYRCEMRMFAEAVKQQLQPKAVDEEKVSRRPFWMEGPVEETNLHQDPDEACLPDLSVFHRHNANQLCTFIKCAQLLLTSWRIQCCRETGQGCVTDGRRGTHSKKLHSGSHVRVEVPSADQTKER